MNVLVFRDSLRQLLVTLFDRGELAQLAAYPYTDMIDDVEAIIEARCPRKYSTPYAPPHTIRGCFMLTD